MYLCDDGRDEEKRKWCGVKKPWLMDLAKQRWARMHEDTLVEPKTDGPCLALYFHLGFMTVCG